MISKDRRRLNKLTTAVPTASAGDMTAWHRALGEIIYDLGSPQLPRRLANALEHLVHFELIAMFAYRGRSKPIAIFDNFERAQAKGGIAAYIGSTYVLNPFYQAYLNGLRDGVYRIRDLAPDAFFESEHYKSYRALPNRAEEIGYITENWPEGFSEIDVAVTVEKNVIVEISIYRSLSDRGFRDEELGRLAAVLPVLRALLQRYWREYEASNLQNSPPDSRVHDAFVKFGESVLTEREREVIQLILRGHSSESIGFNLGISLGTVKTHRRNAYTKLGISSQSELLSLFLKLF